MAANNAKFSQEEYPQTTGDSLKILVIDDNPADRELYQQFLIDDFDQQYMFEETGMGKDGIRLCTEGNFHCVLLDYNLPDMTGVEFLNALEQTVKIKTPLIMLTGQGDETIAAGALRAGASDYLPKRVVSTESLKRTINNAVEKFHLRNAFEDQTHKLQIKNKELTRKHDEIQRFYQTVSHELKTPLTSMKEFVSIMLDGLAGPITKEQTEYLTLVKDSCMQMANSVNDLIDVTRLETGKFRIELEPNNLEATLQQVLSSMNVIAKQKLIRLKLKIEENLPEVYMDPKRVDQILTNLINNAVKFTEKNGKIIVSAQIDQEKPEYIKISVTDNGSGIEPEKLKHVFERLYQVNPEHNVNDSSTSLGGLGLGLSICKDLIKLHDGEISVKSKLGIGSIFSFTLPIYFETGLDSLIQEVY